MIIDDTPANTTHLGGTPTWAKRPIIQEEGDPHLIGLCSDCLWVLRQSRLYFESPLGHRNLFIGSSRQRSITKEAMAHMFPLPYGPGAAELMMTTTIGTRMRKTTERRLTGKTSATCSNR